MPRALRYLGEDPDSKDPAVLEKGAALLEKVRPYIRKFHSSENINALANGDICLASMLVGRRRHRQDARRGGQQRRQHRVRDPEGGRAALVRHDGDAEPTRRTPTMPTPSSTTCSQPEVMAKISNFVTYPNAVPASLAADRRGGEGRPEPVPDARGAGRTCSSVTPFDQRAQRTVTRLWTKLVTGS